MRKGGRKKIVANIQPVRVTDIRRPKYLIGV